MNLIFFLAASLIPPCSSATTNPTLAINTTTSSVRICRKDCDVGNGPQTCDEIISEGTESTCHTLELQGCKCDGCTECGRLTTTHTSDQYTPKSTTTPTVIDSPLFSDRIPVAQGYIHPKNKWTKMPGFRCARDNRDVFAWQEWWFNSIMGHGYDSMEECQKLCEDNPYCGACDYWPEAPKHRTNYPRITYGNIRMFFLCDLRDQAPCPNHDNCSHVMLLDRQDKNWVREARACKTDASCGYMAKMVRAMHYDWYNLYQGGMLLPPDVEYETYTCTESQNQTSTGAPSDATFPHGSCLRWTMKEVDALGAEDTSVESEYGTCFCFRDLSKTPWVTVDISSASYCAQWSCSQTEVTVSVGASRPANYHRFTNYTAFYSGYSSDREIRNCACTLESENGKFCQEWDCQENINLAGEYQVSWDDFDELETERYVCTDTNVAGTLNGDFCVAWTGNIVGRKEFELSECKVTSPHSNYPSTWSCVERGWHFWQRQWAPVVVFLILLIIVHAAVLCIYIPKKKRSSWPEVKEWPYALTNWGVFILTLVICTMCAGIIGFLALLGTYAALAFITCNLCCVVNPNYFDK